LPICERRAGSFRALRRAVPISRLRRRPSGTPAAKPRRGPAHLLESGAELPVIQILLGHADPRDTMVYLHLSTRQLRAAPNPLDTLELASVPGREPAAS